ncbi:hypothetical protein EVAR_38560_1 [Eumeta japonica]|uniref:Uncharacterized protein n=1 Tax=Eumeta variegata TaxID=151549 RepID=A0A4C1WS58_EUMVA|nr:hypothetical protein EVAR_38560_1 [Eumeta japonica]
MLCARTVWPYSIGSGRAEVAIKSRHQSAPPPVHTAPPHPRVRHPRLPTKRFPSAPRPTVLPVPKGGKEEKNPLLVVRVPGRMRTRPFRHRDAVGARLPYGCPLSRHLGIGGHMKFTELTETSEGGSVRRGERTGLMTFKGRNDLGNPYS